MVRMHLQLVKRKFVVMCLYSCYWFPVLLLKTTEKCSANGKSVPWSEALKNSQHPVSSLMGDFRKKSATAILFVEQQNTQ